MVYMMFLDWQLMSNIILHVFPFLTPVIMRFMFCISVRYILLLSLPLRVSMKISLLLNAVSSFFGCFRFTTSLVSSMTAFIFL